MSGFCLGVAVALIQASIPAERLTLAWTHSVEKIPWEEDYVIRDGRLVLTEARVQGNGAGMEPPEDAVWREGWWRYTPPLEPLSKVVLTHSPYAGEYRLCWAGDCVTLATLVGSLSQQGGRVELFPCPSGY